MKRFIWWVLGIQKLVDQHNANCKFLSDSILGNRKRISELRTQVSDLELRVWELEDHTLVETFEKTTAMLDEWTKLGESMGMPKTEELVSAFRKLDEAVEPNGENQ